MLMCNEYATLTLRQREILLCVHRGDRSIKIAEALGISRGTVDVHIQNILHKLHVSSRQKAAKIFAECPVCQSTHPIDKSA